MKIHSAFFQLLILLSIGLTMCKKDDKKVVEVVNEPTPEVDFTYEQVSPDDLKTFKFVSKSKNYKELIWQFGDDSVSVEDTQIHTYQFFGKYKVVLTARNGQGYWAKKEVVLNLVNPAFDPNRVGENYIQTVGGRLTVSKDNNGGPDNNEGSKKLVDGSRDTKFLFDYPSTGGWMTFEFLVPTVVEAYTMISANDAPSRDPKSWRLEASDNNLDWTVLDTQTGILWTGADNNTNRKTVKIFHFNNSVAYKYYRLYITENNGSNLFQQAEWTLNKSQPL